jgi:hypothetical protein
MSSALPVTWRPHALALTRMRLRVAQESALHESHLTRQSHADYLIRKSQNDALGGGIASATGYASLLNSGIPLSERRDTQVADDGRDG